MATKVKGFFKGFKQVTEIFVVKEHEMEIGYPTDVKHVAHIGWDGRSADSPSRMNECKPSSDSASASLSNSKQSNKEPSCASQESDQPKAPRQSRLASEDGSTQPDVPKAPKKKRKKQKVSSAAESSTSRSSTTSVKQKASYANAVGDGTVAEDQLRRI